MHESSGRILQHAARAIAGDSAPEDASVYFRHNCFDDPLRLQVVHGNMQGTARGSAFIRCETFNLSEGGSLADHVEQVPGVREVDCAIDCVGFEGRARELGVRFRSARIAIHSAQFTAITSNPRSPNAAYPGSQLASAAVEYAHILRLIACGLLKRGALPCDSVYFYLLFLL